MVPVVKMRYIEYAEVRQIMLERLQTEIMRRNGEITPRNGKKRGSSNPAFAQSIFTENRVNILSLGSTVVNPNFIGIRPLGVL